MATTITTRGRVPAADVWETGDEIVYAFDLPGTAEHELTVELSEPVLTVTTESHSHSLALPQGVTEDLVRAEYRFGVLEVRVSKPEPHRIPVEDR